MVLTIQTSSLPAVTVSRPALKAKELVYIAVANKPIKYSNGKSRIVYIGTTAAGVDRIAVSAANKAGMLLGHHGITSLEFFVVTSSSKSGTKTWRKLERGLLLAFKDVYGEPPTCNTAGKRMKWTDETDYFSNYRLTSIIEKYSLRSVTTKAK